MSKALGIDLSSKAIDLVLLDEDTNRALWHPIQLTGATAFERARDVRRQMPAPTWFVNEDVYLVGIERPFVRHGQDVIRLVEGAVLSCIPRELEVWEVSVSQWKRHVDIPIREKPTYLNFHGCDYTPLPTEWKQDAYDALGVAMYVRDVNADAVRKALEAA